MFKVLLIEDSASDALILQKTCEDAGFRGNFYIVNNGAKALELLDNASNEDTKNRYGFNPDIIILDLGLPAFTGHEVLAQIRNSSFGLNVPVIVLTSSDNPQDRDAALSNGAKLFITKPFDLDGYLQIARRLVFEEFPKLSSNAKASRI